MITVFGLVCLDRIRRIPKLPASGGYVEVEEEIWMLGGEAANTAAALVEWGAEVALFGNDPGQSSQAELLRSMLGHHRLVVHELPTGNGDANTPLPAPVCDIYLTPDGDRTMFGQGFSQLGKTVRTEHLELPTSGWFTVEPNLGSAAREVSRRAHAKGLKTYLMDFLEPEDPIVPGSCWQSSTDWVGTRGNTQKNVEWLRRFVDTHHCFGILSDGPNGFVAGGNLEGATPRSVRAYPPFPAPEIVDTTGAGDAFRAGMLFGLDSGWELAQSLRFASAAGCLSCGSLGGSQAPALQDVMAYVNQHADVGKAYE